MGSPAAGLLALVLLFRLLIPAGYMIAPDHSGRPGLVLCAASAGTAAERSGHSADEAGHSGTPEPAKPGERPCPLASPAAPPLPPAPPEIVPPGPIAAAAPEPATKGDLRRLPSAAPPPPATGPPPSV